MRPYPNYWIEYAETYPYMFDYEWPIYLHQHTGRMHIGDAVFTDGYNNFLVVEVKNTTANILSSRTALSRTHRHARRKKKNKIVKQVEFYTNIWHANHPEAVQTEGIIVTNQKLLQIIAVTES